VSPEAQERARQIALEALAKRLSDIDMSPREWSMYEGILKRVKDQVRGPSQW